MKRFFSLLLAALAALSLAGCGSSDAVPAASADAPVAEAAAVETQTPEIDVDLTALSSTMVYSEVFNMVNTPEDYTGKVVKMEGAFAVYEDEASGNVYYACIIADAAACCSQGIEFIPDGDYQYPEDYPALGTDITVTGVFGTYEEDGYLYCTLRDAEMTV